MAECIELTESGYAEAIAAGSEPCSQNSDSGEKPILRLQFHVAVVESSANAEQNHNTDLLLFQEQRNFLLWNVISNLKLRHDLEHNKPVCSPQQTPAGIKSLQTCWKRVKGSQEESDEESEIVASLYTSSMSGVLPLDQQFSIPTHTQNAYWLRMHERSRPCSVVSMRQENSIKNYHNNLCYDTTRVKLRINTETLESDYIYANYVDGYNHPKAYICSQSPLPATCLDFWTMIWQEDVRVIAEVESMEQRLTPFIGRYFPEKPQRQKTFGNFVVVLKATQYFRQFVLTTLSLQNSNSSESNQMRTIFHFEREVLDNNHEEDFDFIHGTLTFITAVKFFQYKATQDLGYLWKGHPLGPPIVLNCSDGLARNGVFVLADVCMDMIDDIQRVNIYAIADLLDQQKATFVDQNSIGNYMHCIKLLKEYAHLRDLIPNLKRVTDI